MTQINACEFMIKGYHYTEPTNPSRTDSCRLYIDTSISGEESSIASEIWNPPSTGTLATDTKNTSTYQLKLKGFHNFYVKN